MSIAMQFAEFIGLGLLIGAGFLVVATGGGYVLGVFAPSPRSGPHEVATPERAGPST